MVDFAQVTLLASGAVVLVHQMLKAKIVPVSFANRYPVPTNIVLSVLAAVVVNYKHFAGLHGVADWATEIGLISVIAAVAYNQLLERWVELKETEGVS